MTVLIISYLLISSMLGVVVCKYEEYTLRWNTLNIQPVCLTFNGLNDLIYLGFYPKRLARPS